MYLSGSVIIVGQLTVGFFFLREEKKNRTERDEVCCDLWSASLKRKEKKSQQIVNLKACTFELYFVHVELSLQHP